MKAVHKESLQKQSSLQNAVAGRMREWEVEGSKAQTPGFPASRACARQRLTSFRVGSMRWKLGQSKASCSTGKNKELHKETRTKHTSSTKTKEQVKMNLSGRSKRP